MCAVHPWVRCRLFFIDYGKKNKTNETERTLFFYIVLNVCNSWSKENEKFYFDCKCALFACMRTFCMYAHFSHVCALFTGAFFTLTSPKKFYCPLMTSSVQIVWSQIFIWPKRPLRSSSNIEKMRARRMCCCGRNVFSERRYLELPIVRRILL